MAEHTLLILGSMDEFVQLAEDAKARGYRTVIVDGYAEGPAKAHGDAAFDADIRDTAALATLCESEGVDGMITAYSDVLFENMVRLSCATGIPCYGNYAGMEWLRSKTKMKAMFRMLGVPYPRSVLLENAEDICNVDLQFPCVMKPRDGYGSRGIFVVEDKQAAVGHFEETLGFCMNESGVILEEYCDGYEFNMITWIADGRAYAVSIADREKSHEVEGDIPHVSRLTYPSRFWRDVVDDALAIVQKVSVFTGIQNGPLCMQFFWSPQEGIRVCETAGRVFGYEHELVELGSGLRIEDLLLDTVYDKAALEASLTAHSLKAFKGVHAGLYFHGRETVVGNLDEARARVAALGDALDDALWYYAEGDEVSHGRGAKPYLLRLYVHGDDYGPLDADCDALFRELAVPGKDGASILYHNEVPAYPPSE